MFLTCSHLTATEIDNPTIETTYQSIRAFLEEAVSVCHGRDADGLAIR